LVFVAAEFMIDVVLKISFVGFVFLTASCAVKEQTVQSQENLNANFNQAVETNQNVNSQSSNTKTVETKTVDYFAHFKPEHREVLREWLKSKPFLRPAVEVIDNGMFQEKNYRDKENFKKNFEENMKMLRDTVGEKGYQYYSVGDMNRDGKVDFAVLLVDSSSKDTDEFDDFALAIFNAPFKRGQSPAYFEKNLNGVTNSYIVYNLMTEKHLYLGKFESDVYCATYYPKGKTYYFKDCMDE
jgi:hypothetical protein